MTPESLARMWLLLACGYVFGTGAMLGYGALWLAAWGALCAVHSHRQWMHWRGRV